MGQLEGLKPKRVFDYFEEISAIPRGSGDREKISQYCLDFAEKNGLKAERDDAFNVIIYKDGTAGYENAKPVILQGHLDMVCQKTEDCSIDFLTDGLKLLVEGDFIRAEGTTLGADNGIAVAMILTILESDSIPHPPIEAVFTTDEEIGMLGAMELTMSKLKGRKMINIDSEEEDILTVSCAGGSEVALEIPLVREKRAGQVVQIAVKGLKGGHSGVEIDKGRVNANLLLGRILQYAKRVTEFSIVSLTGGDKGNAIPRSATAELMVTEAELLTNSLQQYGEVIQKEMDAREPEFTLEVKILPESEGFAICSDMSEKLVYLLLCAPNGIQEMSMEISGLVETSLNLGVLKTEEEKMTLCFALRSNKQSALTALEEKVTAFASCIPCKISLSGQYPPWEFKSDSVLQQMYQDAYREKLEKEIQVEAIHAGLECGVFAAGLPGLDCISVGPNLYDVHTTEEKMSIASVERVYGLVLDILEKCK